MRKVKAKRVRSAKNQTYRRRAITGTLLGLILVGAVLSEQVLLHHFDFARSGEKHHALRPAIAGSYLYYVLKDLNGFTLARAREGFNDQPAESPQALTSFGNGFGQTTSDNVLSLQLSPDGRYLAIDGTRSDCELVWLFDTRQLILHQEPATTSGTFLRWLPGSSAAFLFRPMFPLGPDAPMDKGNWNPGLWKVDAASGRSTNLDIHMASTFLIDAIASPDGKKIIYSTTAGLGDGSTVWSMDSDGQHQTCLLQLADSAQGIAGMFAWSPDGQTLAYERLADSPTPFLPAAVWAMNNDGTHQRFLAEGDGGHGFALKWSPDGSAIAFVSRTNLSENLANLRPQSLKSAIEEVNVKSGKVRVLAGPVQTGMQINTDPTWSANSSYITFLAFNPLNPEFGGSPRYWSVGAGSATITPNAEPLTDSLTHVIAFQ